MNVGLLAEHHLKMLAQNEAAKARLSLHYCWKPHVTAHMILAKKRIRLCGCTNAPAPVLLANPRRQGFSRRGSIIKVHVYIYRCFSVIRDYSVFTLHRFKLSVVNSSKETA